MYTKNFYVSTILVLLSILMAACESANATFEPRGLFSVDGDMLILHDGASACIRESDAVLNVAGGSAMGVTENSMIVASGNVTITVSTLGIDGTFEVIDCEPLSPADLGMPEPQVVTDLAQVPQDVIDACTADPGLPAAASNGIPFDCFSIRALGETEPPAAAVVLTCDWTVNPDQDPAPQGSFELRADGSTWMCDDGIWILWIPVVDEPEPETEPAIAPESETEPVNDIPAAGEPMVFEGEDTPVLHHDQSQPPEAGPGSFDIGVNEGQIGLVFGVDVYWMAGGLDAGGNGCSMVVLNPGFYPDLTITDGRYEIYTLPERDQDGWITVLATQRVAEQAGHYGCPDSMDHVLVWNADPHQESWATRRRASGVDYLIPFYAGDTVYGFSIYRGDVTYVEGVGHEGELLCDGGNCYLQDAPFDGWCGGCVVNSWWKGEIPDTAVPIAIPPKPY